MPMMPLFRRRNITKAPMPMPMQNKQCTKTIHTWHCTNVKAVSYLFIQTSFIKHEPEDSQGYISYRNEDRVPFSVAPQGVLLSCTLPQQPKYCQGYS